MKKNRIVLLFIFSRCFSAEKQPLLDAPGQRALQKNTGTFSVQAQERYTIVRFPDERDLSGVALSGSTEENCCDNKISCCCCSRSYTRRFLSCGALSCVLLTGITALCLWKLKHYDPSCHSDNC